MHKVRGRTRAVKTVVIVTSDCGVATRQTSAGMESVLVGVSVGEHCCTGGVAL